MALIRIIRVKRTDDDQYLLLQVTQNSETRPLDLKLIATEYEHVYHGSIKASQISSIKATTFQGDDDELRDTLLLTFLQEQPDGASQTLQGLETVAVLQKDSFVVTIRKNIGGITQRVASITLVQDDEREEISPFEWADTAAARVDHLQAQLISAQQSESEKDKKIEELQSQMAEMIALKKENEEEILQKCAALINTKKQRIRELSQLLKKHKIDVDAVNIKTEPESSRPRKRKAKQDDDGDVNMEAQQEDESDAQQETDEETADELEDQPIQSNDDSQPESQPVKTTAIPPQRELPFKSRATRSTDTSQTISKPTASQHEDDSTEDEL